MIEEQISEQIEKTVYQALEYFNLELSIIPLSFKQKDKPIDKFDDYYNESADIKELATDKKWFNVNRNIAILTGEQSDIIVIDIDSSEHFNILALEEIPTDTPRVKTSRGYHLYFAYPKSSKRIGNGAKRKIVTPSGKEIEIDFRGNKGYALAPPSVHPSGTVYEWEIHIEKNRANIRAMPEWLLKQIVAPKQNTYAEDNEPSMYKLEGGTPTKLS